MLSKSIRGLLTSLIAVSLLVAGYSHVNAQAWTLNRKTAAAFYQGNIPFLLTGTIYTQPLNSTGGLIPSSWWSPDGSDADQYVWDDFTLPANQSITDIQWYGGYDPTIIFGAGAAVDFSVKIYPSIAAGTQPAVSNPPLVSYLVGGNAGETSAGSFNGINIYSYSFTLPAAFDAVGGTKYWIQIEAYEQGTPDWGLALGTVGDGKHFKRTVSLLGDPIHYQVGNGDVAFTLLGLVPDKITPTVMWSSPADITYDTALSGTQLNATASVPGNFVYNPADGTVLNAGPSQTLSVDFIPTDSTTYNSVLGTTVSINVDKATPIVTWANPTDITYGTALSGTQLNATASVPGNFVYAPVAGTILNAGSSQTLSVDFTPTDSMNYNSVLGTTVTINVNKATPVVTWANPTDITYGTPLSGMQLNATASVPGNFVYSPAAGTILNAGMGQTLSADFTPTDSTNYNSVLGTKVLINVNKATPIITWANPADITYGTALSGTQLNATASVPGNFVFTPAAGTVLNAGMGQTLSVDFTPTDSTNYNNVLGTKVAININKATPIVTWSNPADIGFGIALSGTQLNATASVPGVFVYTPAVGTVLNVGDGQILSVDFTPTDSTNYNSVLGKTVTINVNNKATPIITWANPADITYGTALSGTQLNAIASVPGSFVYTPAAGTVLNAGPGQTLSVDFTPTDSVNYNSVPGTKVAINVNKATPIVRWANPADITFGTVLSGTQLNATASVPGNFVYSPAAGTVLNAGAGQTLSVDFTPTDSINYNSVLGTMVTINVNNTTAPTNTAGQVFGNGKIGLKRWGRGTFFQFWVNYRKGNSAPRGSFIYIDTKAHVILVATSFDQLVINGSQARFTGFATVNGWKNVWFEVNVTDTSKHGSRDNFTINIPSLDNYSTGGSLVGGNITIQRERSKPHRHDDHDN